MKIVTKHESQWIKCSERLPEKERNVLIFNHEFGDKISISWIDLKTNKWFKDWGSESCCGDLKEFYYEDNEITHWMPLPPEPPTSS